MKKIGFTIGSMVFLMAGLWIGLKVFTKHVYGRCDCERFNIDNIELRTGVDIPKVVYYSCDFNEEEQLKLSTFTVDQDKIKMEDYILHNGFEKMADTDKKFIFLASQIESEWSQNAEELYAVNGALESHSWEAVLNKNSGDLWVAIEYNN